MKTLLLIFTFLCATHYSLASSCDDNEFAVQGKRRLPADNNGLDKKGSSPKSKKKRNRSRSSSSTSPYAHTNPYAALATMTDDSEASATTSTPEPLQDVSHEHTNSHDIPAGEGPPAYSAVPAVSIDMDNSPHINEVVQHLRGTTEPPALAIDLTGTGSEASKCAKPSGWRGKLFDCLGEVVQVVVKHPMKSALAAAGAVGCIVIGGYVIYYFASGATAAIAPLTTATEAATTTSATTNSTMATTASLTTTIAPYMSPLSSVIEFVNRTANATIAMLTPTLAACVRTFYNNNNGAGTVGNRLACDNTGSLHRPTSESSCWCYYNFILQVINNTCGATFFCDSGATAETTIGTAATPCSSCPPSSPCCL